MLLARSLALLAVLAPVQALAQAIINPQTNATNLITGTLPSARLTGSYTGVTGTGTLTAGATGAGFTVALGSSTITGTLSATNGGTGVASLGTGVATALGVNIGSAGAFITFNGALGTPSSGTATNITGVTLAGHATQATNTVVGNATSGSAAPTALAVGTCSTAASAVIWTTNTGFGCNTSITAAAVAVGGITGLGTGVATALALNVGSAGAPVTFNGALGTPSSGTATNITGVTLSGHATQATNTVVGNATNGSAAPTALAIGTCSTAGSALKWTTDTGFGCNTAITASAIAVGGITGLGTGVATALALNVGSAGAPVTFNGAGGTPSSLTLTNATGLPVAGGGTGATAFTAGSVVFAGTSGVYTQDNANFFWDDTNNRLGISINNPSSKLAVVGLANVGSGVANTEGMGYQLGVTSPTAKATGSDMNSMALFSNDALANNPLSMVMSMVGHATAGSRYGYIQVSDYGTGSYRFLVLQPSGSNVGIGVIAPSAQLHTSGTVLFAGLTTAAGTPNSICQNNSTKEIVVNAALTCTVSSLDFKHDFEPFGEPAVPALMAMRPGSFFYNDSDRQRLGFVSEYMAVIDRRLADGWDAQDHPRSIDQNAILAVTVKSLQEAIKRIEVLEAR